MTSILIANNVHVFQTRRASFKSQQSPLNPAANSVTFKPAYSTESTRVHLSNLDKLLGNKQTGDTNNSGGSTDQNHGRVLTGGLKLNRLWPEMGEMSPKHMNRLQRLLSQKPEYSPRNNLGSCWAEYHGSRNWAGLLDPLDENLRREIVRYGEFVQAAYQAFHSDPAMPTDSAPSPRVMAVPDRSYKVTKSLYATSSVGLPEWVDDVAPDLAWMTQRSSWVGYVAVCDDKKEIQRMGRRDITIALRGTSTCLEWIENIRAQLVPVQESGNNKDFKQSKVECGFLSLYKTGGAHVPSLAESVVKEVQRLMELYKGETLSISVTGHSLGAALALLVADELSSCATNIPPLAVFSFGGPRVGNNEFAKQLERKNVKVLRIVNNQDLITKIPGVFMENRQVGCSKKQTKVMQFITEILERNNPLAYSHVGVELRVDTRTSPYLKPNADMACSHDLEAYLHLVDGFSSSDDPFRANAKRSIWKLLHEQRGNVKKLYTSKAKALYLDTQVKGKGVPAPSCMPSPS